MGMQDAVFAGIKSKHRRHAKTSYEIYLIIFINRFSLLIFDLPLTFGNKGFITIGILSSLFCQEGITPVATLLPFVRAKPPSSIVFTQSPYFLHSSTTIYHRKLPRRHSPHLTQRRGQNDHSNPKATTRNTNCSKWHMNSGGRNSCPQKNPIRNLPKPTHLGG